MAARHGEMLSSFGKVFVCIGVWIMRVLVWYVIQVANRIARNSTVRLVKSATFVNYRYAGKRRDLWVQISTVNFHIFADFTDISIWDWKHTHSSHNSCAASLDKFIVKFFFFNSLLLSLRYIRAAASAFGKVCVAALVCNVRGRSALLVHIGRSEYIFYFTVCVSFFVLCSVCVLLPLFAQIRKNAVKSSQNGALCVWLTFFYKMEITKSDS